MPGPLTDAERDAFLAEPHVAVIAIPRGDRPPHTTPVWYHHEPGGNVTFFTGTQGRRSRKADLIEQAGVASICVQQETFPTGTSPSRARSSRSTARQPPSRCSPSFAATFPRSRLGASRRLSSTTRPESSSSTRSAPTTGIASISATQRGNPVSSVVLGRHMKTCRQWAHRVVKGGSLWAR
jgi:hypothetical protein